MLTFIKNIFDKSSLLTIINSFVITRLDYCNSLLAGVTESNISKLQKLQNACARMVTGAKRKDHITPILKNLHWLPVKERIKFKVMLFVYKCFNSSAPEYLCELLGRATHGRILRSTTQHHFVPQRCHKKIGTCRFSVQGPNLWNECDIEMKCSPSVDTFKNRLKTFLFKKHFNL